MPKRVYFTVVPNKLPKTDPRYQRWLASLKNRPPPWSKGFTKETHPSVRKISKTFKRKKIDNFSQWRERARREGIIPQSYPAFKKNEDLAFLIGLVLGDGHIDKFPRTEKLSIALGTDKPKLINYAEAMVEKVFAKKPNIYWSKTSKLARVDLYQKSIAKRLGVPTGNRRHSRVGIPKWVWRSKRYLIPCLKGLYEAEASLCIHLPTCTYNFAFHNLNYKLLGDVKRALISLKLYPEVRSNAIRLRKRHEVKYFQKLIRFREYIAGWSNGSLVAL